MTLMEILVALGIMAIGFASVLVLFGYAFKAHKQGVDRTQAALLAQKIYSEMSVMAIAWNTADIVIDKSDKRFGHVLDGFEDTFSARINYEPIGQTGDMLKVAIEIRWMIQGDQRSEIFVSVVRRRIELQ
jgi:type II secretory pathway pseudopilin PulG